MYSSSIVSFEIEKIWFFGNNYNILYNKMQRLQELIQVCVVCVRV